MSNEAVIAALVSGALAALITGVVAAIASRGKNRAEAAKINSETAIILLTQMRKDSDRLEKRLEAIQVALTALTDAVETQADALESGSDPRMVAVRLRTDVRTARAVI